MVSHPATAAGVGLTRPSGAIETVDTAPDRGYIRPPMAYSSRSKPPELSGTPAAIAVAAVVISLIGGTWWGWSLAGAMGALLGVLIGAAIGTLVFTIARMSVQTARFAERPAPDVRALPPEQALQVLTAILGMNVGTGKDEPHSGPIGQFGGGLIADVARARERAGTGDPTGALTELRALAEAHPRSPAVPAEIARIERRRGDAEAAVEAAVEAAAQALALAVHGGMNRLAASVFAELEVAEFPRLKLADTVWAQLSRALGASGDSAGAARCRARIDPGSRGDANLSGGVEVAPHGSDTER